jgi:hypothetical protein
MTNQQLSNKAVDQASRAIKPDASKPVKQAKQARKPCKSSSPDVGCSHTGGPTYQPKSSDHSANKLAKQAVNLASKPTIKPASNQQAMPEKQACSTIKSSKPKEINNHQRRPVDNYQ